MRLTGAAGRLVGRRYGMKKGMKGKGQDRDHVDCPREDDDPHMRGEGFGPPPDDQRGKGDDDDGGDAED